MKTLKHIEILEVEGFKLSEEDEIKVNEYLKNENELKYDENTLMIYDEAGNYIADLIDCR